MFKQIKTIAFKLGSYCDLDCEYCYQDHDIKTKNDMFDMYKDLTKFCSHPKLNVCKTLTFKLTGGEPSLYADRIWIAYKELKKIERYKDTKVVFSSVFNGTKIDEMIDYMKMGILVPRECMVSWDGIYSCSKSRKTKVAKYNDEYFQNVICQLGQSEYAKDVIVRIALTENTIDDLVDSFKFALMVGCRRLEYYFINEKDCYSDIDFQKKFMKAVDEIIQLKYQYPDFEWETWTKLEALDALDPQKELLKSINCHHLGKSIYILNDGRITPCAFMVPGSQYTTQDMCIGHIKYGFYKNKIASFIDQFKNIQRCSTNEHCLNMHCFECPAVNLFMNGHMQKRLHKACFERTYERTAFQRVKQDFDHPRYKHTSMPLTWDVDYSMPDLPYANP